jgi:hypothetical protein
MCSPPQFGAYTRPDDMRIPYILCASCALAPAARAQHIHTHPNPSADVAQHEAGTNEFNPAISLVIDSFARFTNSDDAALDGSDLELRLVELGANAWIDPHTWAWLAIIAHEEEIGLEEAAVQYVGFGGNSSLRAGRFFVDFGRQMQSHLEDLPYPERPGVLREYLGEELGGTGVQYGNWFTAGDSTTVRYSVGIFDSLAAEAHSEDLATPAVERTTPDRQELDELSLSVRLAGFTQVGENRTFGLGASLQHIPRFTFEHDASALAATDRSNSVYGIDASFSWTDELGQRPWTFGAEYLVNDGDIGAELDDGGTPLVIADDSLVILDDDVSGYYLWADREWSERDSAGLLFSRFEHPEAGKPEDSELTLYYTRMLSERSRLRFAVSTLDSGDPGNDATAFVVQFTNFFGAHEHGDCRGH